MATRLENLKVTKVDFVDEGANPDAHILIRKKKEEQGTSGVDGEKTGFFKRLLSYIGKAAGMEQSEIDNAVEEITKGDFAETGGEGGATGDASGESEENVKKTAGAGSPEPEKIKPKGEEKKMETRIDKSKMTEAERNIYETLEKKYGVEADDSAVQKKQEVDEKVEKKATTQANAGEPEKNEGQEDVYKNLHPAVKAEIESLKKFKEEAENRELNEIAKKYEIIGKKPEELVPTLKSLKAAGGSAYADMIAILDQTVETVEKSGVFAEIGKSGHGTNENTAEAKIGTIAKGYMEKDPSMSYNRAVAKAWEDNPELLDEYDEQAGF